MSPENRRRLADRAAKAAEASLAAQNYVSPVDVLVGIGWLDPGAVKRWRQGQVDYLERVVQTNLSRISEAMKLFRSWATAKGLIPSEASYVARTPSRQTLRFSKSGTPTIELHAPNRSQPGPTRATPNACENDEGGRWRRLRSRGHRRHGDGL